MPWFVVGLVMVVLAAVAVVRLFVDQTDEPGEAVTVSDVAAVSVDVTEALDVSAGMGLLCEAPMDLYRMTVESTITRWQADLAGGLPDVSAEVSDVDAGAEGSFVIRITRAIDEMSDELQNFRVFVESRAGRSCIVGVGGVDAKRPTTKFSGSGYSRVTSPTPAPRP